MKIVGLSVCKNNIYGFICGYKNLDDFRLEYI